MNSKNTLSSVIILLIIILISQPIYATIHTNDSLMLELKKIPNDKKISHLINAITIGNFSSELSIDYAKEGLEWAKKNNDVLSQARALNYIGNLYYNIANYEQSLSYYQKALRMTMRLDKKTEVANVMRKIGIIYFNMRDYDKALLYFEQTLKIFQELEFLNLC